MLEVNSSNSTYFVKVFGFNEKSDETLYANDSISIIIESEEISDLLNEVGENIYPSSPKAGIYIGSGIVLAIGLVLWKYELGGYFGKKSQEWKEKETQRRRESYKGDEGW